MRSLPSSLLLLFTLSALLIFLSLPSSALPSCLASDLISLQFFQSSISTILPWTNLTNCCLWLGVRCNTHGRVVSLHLPSSNLSGSISPHLFQLSDLQNLNLSSNSLYGNVAPGIANLSMLTSLDLSHNPFLNIGPMPLQLPSTLHYLDISHCGLHGSIFINTSSSLREIFIGDNFFSSFASNNLASMKALQTFDAPRNFLTMAILQTLHNCTDLRLLNLDHNYVRGTIPSEIGMLSKLEIVRLQGNEIAGYIPQEIGNCKQMREIWLDNNHLTGTIPKELGKLSMLTHLSLSNNRLYGSVPDAILGCAELLHLCLSGNMLTGEIPAALGDLPKLDVLLMENNKFSGSMPWEIRRLGRPGELDVTKTRVESSISSGISDAVTYMSTGNPYSGSPLNWSPSCCENVVHIRSKYCKCSGNISNNLAFKRWPWIRFTFNNESLFLLKSSKALQNFFPQRVQTSQGRHVLPLTFSPLMVSAERALTFFNVAHLNPSERVKGEKFHRHHYHRHLLQNSGDTSKGMRPLITGVISGIAVFCGILLIAMVVALCRMKVNPWLKMRGPPRPPPRLPSLRRFRCESSQVFDPSLASISMRGLLKATGDFHPGRVIGDGGFGLVYRATLSDGRTVAVKKLATDGIQGKREFEAELQTLGRIKHPNLVELLAFCKVGDDRALVYEFMENGSLDTWLHERDNGPRLLDWQKRVQIAKGAARGLAYLHHECNPHVLHRDIKSSNILLGKDFEPRIADFGLARHMSPFLSHVSTEVAGTLGYMAPEYHMTLYATRQADVYSFGVLMLELASGKRPSSVLEDNTFRALTTWVHHVVESGCEMDILDPVFKEKPPPHDQVSAYITIANACVSEIPEDRPTMMEAYKQLSEQLEADRRIDGENAEKSTEMQEGGMEDDKGII